jgi:hypothetical protein
LVKESNESLKGKNPVDPAGSGVREESIAIALAMAA